MKERITYLFIRFQEGNCSRSEFDELFQYIALGETDPSLKEILNSVYDAVLGDQEIPSGLLAGLKERQTVAAGFRRAGRGKKRILAAAAAVFLILVFFVYNRFRGAEQAAKERIAVIHTVPRTENRFLLLPDSTQVWLNAASSIEYPQTFDASRRVVALKGEAFFDVKHADKIPFIITTGEVTTEVLGTAFNIKAYPDMEKVTVSVKRGKVRVSFAEKQVATLEQGQEVSVTPKVEMVKERVIRESDAAVWQQGKLVYDDDTVEDIVKDMERVFGVSVVVESSYLKSLRVTTSFIQEDGIERALQVLCALVEADLVWEKEAYFIKQ